MSKLTPKQVALMETIIRDGHVVKQALSGDEQADLMVLNALGCIVLSLRHVDAEGGDVFVATGGGYLAAREAEQALFPMLVAVAISPTLRESLADVSHDIWSHWTRWQFSVCTPNPDGSLTIPAALVERWTRQMNTPYAALSEREKDSDREQADKILLAMGDE